MVPFQQVRGMNRLRNLINIPETNGDLTPHLRRSFGTRSLAVFCKLRFRTQQQGMTVKLSWKCRFCRCADISLDELAGKLTYDLGIPD